MNYSTNFKSLRDEVSPDEWQARVALAACYRLVDLFGMTDLIYNHITTRIPGTDHLLINLYGLLYKEITASSLVKIDVEGNIVWKPDSDYGINKSGYVIHGAIHKARADVKCIIHTHTRAGMAVSAMKCGLLPLAQTAMRFTDVAYHDYEGVALNMDEQARVVADLGNREAMILRNHGLLVVGASIAEAFNNIFRLERACQLQVTALSCNTELAMPPKDLIEATNKLYLPGVRRRFGLLEWPALLKKLDSIDPSYRK
jgi:ribulose-5-phosphate 4-epimerase/fuculose-1-phosphate aldolase